LNELVPSKGANPKMKEKTPKEFLKINIIKEIP